VPNAVQIVLFWVIQASALLAFFVHFEWAYLGLWAASHFLRAIGLTLTFHRYFAHRSFQMGRVARFVWAFIGTAAMQKGPLWWAGHHVNHHRYADREGDPHSPAVSGFYYAHIGWFLNDAKHDTLEPTNPVIRDFSKAWEIAWLDKYFTLPPLLWALSTLIGPLNPAAFIALKTPAKSTFPVPNWDITSPLTAGQSLAQKPVTCWTIGFNSSIGSLPV